MPPKVAPPSTTTDASPSDLAQQDVACPMCDYNLRGLIEPRCPECGYTFLWIDLLDPRRRLHPYLFEHHPERNVWSFIQTVRGSFWPSTFWRTLLPTQPSRTRRLRSYWLLTWLPAALVLFVILLLGAVRNHSSFTFVYLTSGQSYPLLETWAKAVYFTIWHDEFIIIGATACLLLWPWLTFLALQVFQMSMDRAKVKAHHVARCVIYSQDAVVFLVPLLALLWLFLPTDSNREELLAIRGLFIVLLGLAAFFWRITRAYTHYMQFHRPLATIIASQIIVALVFLNVWLAWVFRHVR